MGSIGGLLGTAGGAGGTGFAGPAGTNLHQTATDEQNAAAYAGAQQGIGGQQALLAALQGQAGLGNQSNALAATQGLSNQLAGNNGAGQMASAYGQTQGLASQLAKANGVGMQTGAASGLQNVASQQQGLANQLQNVANGKGPNPAQAMLNQQTGQNIQNQAAMMAGQRGAGSNVGLMARQAAQQGAATQQQAVGQGATMQANQSLGALGQLGQQQQAMAGTQQAIAGVGSGLTAQQQGQQQALAGQAAASVAAQQAQQQMVAGQATNMVNQQIGATNALSSAQQAEQGQILGALGNLNTSAVNQQGNINNANASLANTGMQNQGAFIGGLMSGASSAGGLLGARGGMVHMAEGGMPEAPYPAPNGQGPLISAPAATAAPVAQAAPMPAPVQEPPPGPASSFGQFLSGRSNTGDYLGKASAESFAAPAAPEKTPDTTANAQIQAPPQMGYGSQMLYKGAKSMGSMGAMAAMAARGGLVRAMLSEDEVTIPPSVANSKDPAKASGAYVRQALKSGGTVSAREPSQKATKAGNSYDNDKIPAALPEGAIVIPRSVTQSKNPERSAADFVSKVMAKRRRSA